jgi:hypothetical protein
MLIVCCVRFGIGRGGGVADDKNRSFDDPEVGPNVEGAWTDFGKALERAYQGSVNKDPKKDAGKDPKGGGADG